MGEKYNIKFQDYFKSIWFAKIFFNNYSGSIINLTGSGEVMTVNIPSKERLKFERIKGTVIDIVFYNMFFEQYTNDFIQNGNKDIKLELYKDSQLWFIGYYIPDEVQEPLLYGPSPISLMFTDGLGLLKDVKYNDLGLVLYGKKTPLQVIWECLKETGLQLNLEESCIYYEKNINQGNQYSPLNQIYLDAENFIEDDKDIDCYEILNRLLFIQLVRLFQKDGKWYIIPINAIKNSFVSRLFEYTDSGYNYINYSVKNYYLVFSKSLENLNTFIGQSQKRKINKAWKKFSIKQDYGKDENMIWNGDLDYWDSEYKTPLGFYRGSKASFVGNPDDKLFWTVLTHHNQNDYIAINTLKIEQAINYGLDFTFKYRHDGIEETKIKWQLVLWSGSDSFFLRKDGEWVYLNLTINEEIIPQTIKRSSGSVDVKSKSLSSKCINSNKIPSSGNILLIIYRPYCSHPAGIKPFFITEISLGIYDIYDRIPNEKIHEQIINENNTIIPDIIEIELGDIPQVGNSSFIYRKGLYYKDGDNYQYTSLWNEVNHDNYYSLIKLLANEISKMYSVHTWEMFGKLKARMHLGLRFINNFDGRIFMINEINSFDIKKGEYDVVLFEIDRHYQYMEWESGSGQYIEWEESSGYIEQT